jgi:hypothetical protein
VTAAGCHVVVADDPAVQTAALLVADQPGPCRVTASINDQRVETSVEVPPF